MCYPLGRPVYTRATVSGPVLAETTPPSSNTSSGGLPKALRQAFSRSAVCGMLYMTRIQQERFFNEEEYLRLKGCYQLDEALLQKAPQDMPVLHPLPRIDEIKKDVDDDPRAAYFDQVHNGVYIRMAIILALLDIPDPVTGKKVLEA